MALTHTPEELKRIHDAVERFWFDETGEELGIIKRDRIVAFFTQLIGAASYNRGVADAQAYLQTKLIDLEIDLHEQVRYRPES